MASGGAIWDYISNPSGTKPANNATVGATWGTNISGQPSNDLILNNLQTGAWVVGQTPPWVLNGTSAENAIDYATDVNGVKVPVWKCIANADGNASGGWNPNDGDPSFGKNWFKVDKNKPYRFAVPVKITGGSTGSYYWGIGENTVCTLNTSNKDGNPYFVYGVRSGLVANRWYLLVGYVFPAGSTGNTNAGSGIFDLTTGELVAERWNYCWASDVEYTGTRAYQYYCANAGETQVFGYPTVEIVDGTESKLFDNLGYAALLNAQQKWSDVSGTGKPADYADVTAYNTSAGITGQGALATQNAALWSTQVTGLNKPADNADVTNYNDNRVANSLLLANSGFNLITDDSLSNPSWWGFGSNTLPNYVSASFATSSDQPIRFYTITAGIGQFNWSSTRFSVANSTQYRVKLSMFISSDFVGFVGPVVHVPGVVWALPGNTVADPNSVFPNGHTATSWGSGSWQTREIIVTTSAQADLNWLQTRIYGRVSTGYFAFSMEVTSLFGGAGQINSSNASTYIANAAIGSAQIGSIALVGTSNFSVKSGTAGARMEMDSQVTKVYDSSGVLRVKLGNLSV
jgi:hypothetical protein